MENETLATKVTNNEASTGESTEKNYTDYKALYQAALAEKEALNQKANGLSKENAEFRKREKQREEEEKNQLPIDEKYRMEIEEQKKINSDLMDRINRSEIENAFVSGGIDQKLYSEIVSKLFSSEEETSIYEKRLSLAKSIVDVISVVKSQAEESEKNKATFNDTVRPGPHNENVASDFKRYQEMQQNKISSKRVELV